MSDEPALKKHTGFQHLIAATTYSWAGLLRVAQESAFRQELGALVAGLVLFAFIQASVQDYLVFIILMLVLFAVEGINTAIEEIVDRVSPEISNVGKNAKDLGSFAVACLIIANVFYMAYVVYHKIF